MKSKLLILLNKISNEREKQEFIKKLNNLIDANSKEWFNLVGENQNKPIADEIFKPAWQTRNCNGLWYYASNYGRIILAKQHATKDDLKNSHPVKIKNGYLTNEGLPNDFRVALYTDVYIFVAEAFWEEFSDNYKFLENKYPNERIELHHINNNPNDNRLENLIYLPRSIHAQAHKSFTVSHTKKSCKVCKNLLNY